MLRQRGRRLITVVSAVALVSTGLAWSPSLAAAPTSTSGARTHTSQATQPASPAAKASPTSPVELPARRTRNSRTFSVGGAYKTQLYAAPVNYQDAKGAWQTIDNTMVAAGGG